MENTVSSRGRLRMRVKRGEGLGRRGSRVEAAKGLGVEGQEIRGRRW